MCERNLFPKPSPFDAPFTKPAISTKEIVVGIIFFDLEVYLESFELIKFGLELLHMLLYILLSGLIVNLLCQAYTLTKVSKRTAMSEDIIILTVAPNFPLLKPS